MSASVRPGVWQLHGYSSNTINSKAAQLANAYQELGRELGSDKLKVVGGYTLGRVIGDGAFGSVYLATHRLTGTRCAIKKIPKTASAQLTREIHHHRRLHHPHIVHLHEIVATETHIWLVSELCSGGELFDYLVERGRLLEGEGRRVFGELCTAVGHMHRQGVVHRDLKLENILLDGELRVKLGDLGFAREWQRGRLMETFCGTTGYASPEMLSGTKYLGVETDIWSLGIILYILLCGGLPFDDDDENVMRDLILKGEYEEPEWLSDEVRSLIRGMLAREPSARLSIEQILTHPWFKKTLYDNLQNAASSMDRSLPSSPLPSDISPQPQFFEPFAGPSSSSSYPFMRTHSPLVIQGSFTAPRRADSAPSDASFDFSEERRRGSGETSPTTADEDAVEKEPATELTRTHSGEFSVTERALELLHTNESQTTIRRPGSESPRSARSVSLQGRGRVAVKTTLEGQQEVDEEGDGDVTGELPTFDEHSLHLPTAGHARTPARTKRRSVSSQLSLERRPSHHSTSGQWQAFPAQDFMLALNEDKPELFSTPSEKRLLGQLSDLGIDTGQLVHSVINNACDASAAHWWILRLKQLERGETDEIVIAREASAVKRRERAAAYAREERRRMRAERAERAERAKDAVAAAPPAFPTLVESPMLAAPAVMVSDAGGVTRHITKSPVVLGPAIKSPASDTRSLPSVETRAPMPQTPPRDLRSLSDVTASPGSDASPRERKTRSPSMSMLQRATSAFMGAKKEEGERDKDKDKDKDKETKRDDKDRDDKEKDRDKDKDKRGESPTKLHKPNPKSKKHADGDTSLLSPSASMSPETSPRVEATQLAVSPVSTPMALGLTGDRHVTTSTESHMGSTKSKNSKRDSLWTTFRYLFDEKKRRQKRELITPGAIPAVDHTVGLKVVPTRGLSARHPHVHRTTQPASRRASVDSGRPGFSRRSSSVNSRRSSFTASAPYTSDFAFSPHDPPLLHRHASGRSGGSMTPTSDREGGSRPTSSHSHRRGGGGGGVSRQSSISMSMRSPSMHSDTSGRFRAPVSPLHNYHRRATSGSASTRVRHIKVMHESAALRPRSIASASSLRSNASSRASSIERGERERDRERADSDNDTGTDRDAPAPSIRSGRGQSHRRRLSDDRLPGNPHLLALAHAHARPRSPLSRSAKAGGAPPVSGLPRPAAATKKGPLRDVFQHKRDDDWESEDEGAFVGGLGQGGGGAGGAGGTGVGGIGLGGMGISLNPTVWHAGRRTAVHPSAAGCPPRRGSVKKDKDDDVKGFKAKDKADDAKASAPKQRRSALPQARGAAPPIQEEEEEEE
ncbi:hypothetical protein Q5752_004465 [Cryptotrichosporon argae]